MIRRSFLVGLLVTVGAGFTTPAQGGLFEDLYSGLNYFATPLGNPVFTDGTGFRSNGARQGRLRIVPNEAGGGHRLEFDRRFGVDNSGRSEILDLGNFELEMSGPISFDGSYTTRGIPTATGQLTINNLAYNLRGKSGAQDVDLFGVLSADALLEINPLGFYTARLDVVHTSGDFATEGVLAEVERDTDFNVGPISIKGNIFVDMLTFALSSFGVNPGDIEGIFPRSPMDRINEEIRNSIEREAAALGVTLEAEPIAGDPSTFKRLDDQPGLTSSITVVNPDANPIPEPASLALLVAGAVLLVRPRS